MFEHVFQKICNLLGMKNTAISENKEFYKEHITFDKSVSSEARIEVQNNKPPKLAAIKKEGATKATITPISKRFNVCSLDSPRYIAYTLSGNQTAHKILLCLPGLLETRESFAILHGYFLEFKEIQVLSVDYVGRGDSDPLCASEQYLMSLYLSDLCKFINEIIYSHSHKEIELTILGTSMGGVLAMYLTQALQKPIHQIILNDVAVTVNWTALFNLYKTMSNDAGFMELRKLSQELKVAERAITDVQLPGHFDLPYRADVWGMNFHDALASFNGKVCLIYGSESKICNKRRVDEAAEFLPYLQVFCIKGSHHPVPYTLEVCEILQAELNIKG